jgi:DNA repair protein RadC
LYLSNADRPLGKYKACKKPITGRVAYVRLLVGKALEELATRMITAHNHPSGTLKPSDQDKTLTKKLKETCNNMDITSLDHVIISTY